MKFPQVDPGAHEQVCRELAELGMLEPIADDLSRWRLTQRGRRSLSALLAVGWFDRARLLDPKPKPRPRPKLTLVKG